MVMLIEDGGGEIPSSPTSLAPLLVKNIATSVFASADKVFLNLSEKSKLVEFIRYVIGSCFLLFLHVFSFIYNLIYQPPKHDMNVANCGRRGSDTVVGGGGRDVGETGIGRALTQVLSIVNNIPVSSRKHEVVRSLAEKLIDGNQRENSEALREVNRNVLSTSFSKTLSQIKAALVELGDDIGNESAYRSVGVPLRHRLNRVIKAVGTWSRTGKSRKEVNKVSESFAEKLAAELLWLAEKLAVCGCVEEAFVRWASASNLGWLALSAEPRLQATMVKLTAFLVMQAKNEGQEQTREINKENQRQTKLKMLVSWMPLLCRGSNGTDAPALTISERTKLQEILEEMIEDLDEEEEQEQVLSLWLHHFTLSPSSDWPNLQSSYARWCNASRHRLLLLQ